jgi:hypothetical protein
MPRIAHGSGRLIDRAMGLARYIGGGRSNGRKRDRNQTIDAIARLASGQPFRSQMNRSPCILSPASYWARNTVYRFWRIPASRKYGSRLGIV